MAVDGEGVRLKRVVSTEYPNYLFVYLDITEEAEPGNFELHFSIGNTNYRTDTLMDPYASKSDLNATVKGWFVDSKQVLMLEHSIQFPTDRL